MIITRQEVEKVALLPWTGSIELSEREYTVLATAALKARYTHINKRADSDPLYQTGMDYLEEE